MQKRKRRQWFAWLLTVCMLVGGVVSGIVFGALAEGASPDETGNGAITFKEISTLFIDKGNITFKKDCVTGYVKSTDGNYDLQDIPYDENTLYVVTQLDSSIKTTNYISFSGKQDTPYHVVIKDVNMGRSMRQYISGATVGGDSSLEGMVFIPADSETKKVNLYLAGKNVLNGIRYYTGTEYNYSSTNTESFLYIDSAKKVGMDEGKLFIPEEVKIEDIPNFISESAYAYNRWNAAIGGTDSSSVVTGLTIAGGEYQILSSAADNCTAIGGGGNGDAEIAITGGNIYAVCNGTGATIGGGIGYTKYGGNAKVSISGGTIFAMNYGKLESNGLTVGGVAIGGGSSFQANGSSASIIISGGTVNAYAVYGNGIGSGNSAKASSDLANIQISGGIVKTNAIGGGSSESAAGGSAEIRIDGGNTTCEYLDNNFIGAYGIGGGFSKEGNGGDATVRVTDGVLNCGNGTIGGGISRTKGNGGNAYIVVLNGELHAGMIGGGSAEDKNEQYNGGDASIYVSGGTLVCASIGGGNSVSGKPGSVTGNGQSAGVVVTGGTLKTGTIGGGTNENGDIGYATAEISGGFIQGRFILSNTDPDKKCFFHMSGGTIDNTELVRAGNDQSKTAKLGGAVYLSDPNGEVIISGGTIQNSSAANGGALYMTAGSFTLSGTGIITGCSASENGGAVYLKDGKVTISGGSIHNCEAALGGAVYLEKGDVTLTNGSIGKEGASNKAQAGGGVYIAGGNLTINGGSVMNNEAKNGGGAYLAGGALQMSGGMLAENHAEQNGGGAYLADGSLLLSGGQISRNTSVQGAGAYLQNGNLIVSGSGSFAGNQATGDGGGAYLTGGSLTVDGGSFDSNTAGGNGGGAYLAGGTLIVNGGSFKGNNAKNGGGAYAADGKVRMFGGSVTGNHAGGDGGGLYVSSAKTAADIVIRSGSITNNTSGGNGGGIAVVSSNGNAQDRVVLGLLETHPGLNLEDHAFTPFDYTDSADGISHNHAACPVLSGNTSTGDGGGIYMNSSAAEIDIFCLHEQDNKSAKNTNGNSIMTVGGKVNIGDQDQNNQDARGNIIIGSAMLVEGGNVYIWGNMQNPVFANNILVDIKANAGVFEDHRAQTTSKKSYKVHYFENFSNGGTQTPTGLYTAIQYADSDTISALGTLFIHTGWKIVGWDTKADGTGTRYRIGDTIAQSGDHGAWGNDEAGSLVLYAIWARTGYTVIFNPNSTAYTGSMGNQTFEYNVSQVLSANGYRVLEYRFDYWTTEPDGSGTRYEAGYSLSQMTTEDGATITLYAQWVACTHLGGAYPGTVSYTTVDTTITETCDCGHTASVTLSAASVYFDGNSHSAILSSNGTILAGLPTILYRFRQTESGSYGALPDGRTLPLDVGFYRASITVGNQTVFVAYEIRSPQEGITFDAKVAAGQYFIAITGNTAVRISLDDAFTVQIEIIHLNTEVYQGVPTLSFGGALPSGTTVIMQTGNSYYWYSATGSVSEIALTEFVQMGGSDHFQYSRGENQAYRFIVDFSQADASVRDWTVALTYQPTGASGALSGSVTVETIAKTSFGAEVSGSNLTVDAPKADASNRWHEKGLLLILTAPDDIPADATLTMTVGNQTTVFTLNARKQFVVPLSWEGKQAAGFGLSSAFAAQHERQVLFNVALYVGASGQKLLETGVTAELTLTIPADTAPSLKLSGKTQVVSLQDRELILDVDMRNTEGCTVSAIIQIKTDNGYSGNYLTVDALTAGSSRSFSLTAITAPGSYRLYVTVSKDGRTLLSVPYYFIVK